MATKLESARLATASGVDVVIASGLEGDVLPRLIGGERIGTYFPATGSKVESRKRWMLSGLSNRGGIVVDEGASRALVRHHRSLLPAGVQNVHGSFERGDIVSVIDPGRNQIAARIVNYDSNELGKIKGTQSGAIEAVLGHHYGDEAVHRNNMVVL